MSADSRNYLQYRFIGEWVVQRRKTGSLDGETIASEEANEVRVIISPVPSLDSGLRVAYSNGTGCTVGEIYSFDGSSGNLRHQSDVAGTGSSSFISFWQSAPYDIIFAMKKESVVGGPARSGVIWTARRRPVDTSGSSEGRAPLEDGKVGDLVDKYEATWLVKMSSGVHSATDRVRMRLYSERGKLPVIYGLYNAPDGKEEDLYDIVCYDPNVGSCNSLFGVRSLCLQSGDDGVFLLATFSNTASLPFVQVSSLGRLMGFENPEEGGNCKTCQSNDEADDPDVGVWVAEHDG